MRIKLICVGIVAGLINGFLGAGGGLLIVPMLSNILSADAKVIHATTLACIFCSSIGASIIYFVQGMYDFSLILPCSIGGLIAGIFGTFLIKKLKNNVIDLLFSFVLVLAGVLMIVF